VLRAFVQSDTHARVEGRWRERLGETTGRLGLRWFPDRTVPQASLSQTLTLERPRLELRGEASYNGLATNTALLRAAALRRGGEAEGLIGLPWHLELGASASAYQFLARNGVLLSRALAARTEVAFRLPLGGVVLRPRLDASRDAAASLHQAPDGMWPYLASGAPLADLLPVDYGTVGAGLTVSSRRGDVGEGRGAALSLRYRLDVWAGELWPADKITFAVEGGVGLMLSQHQELAATGFYYADRDGEPGQQWTGANLRYVMRWF
jgi:hypothetical protein